jgi:hypothetical protein
MRKIAIALSFSFLAAGATAHADIFKDLKKGWDKAVNQVKKTAKGVKDAVDSAGKTIRQGMRDAGQKIIDAAKKVGGAAAKQALHGPFYGYIMANRVSFKRFAKALRKGEKEHLAKHFPKRLIDKVRVLERNDTGYFNKSAGATTFGNDFIIIRKGERSNDLLVHEFVHVCQYDRYGVKGFAFRYADQYVDGGFSYRNIKFEKQAYAFQKDPKGHIKKFLGYCSK